MVGCAGYLADLAAVLLTADLESSLSPIFVWPAAITELLAKSARPAPVHV